MRNVISASTSIDFRPAGSGQFVQIRSSGRPRLREPDRLRRAHWSCRARPVRLPARPGGALSAVDPASRCHASCAGTRARDPACGGDVLERLDVGQRDARRSCGWSRWAAELDHPRADPGDEAAVAGCPGGELGGPVRSRRGCVACIDQRARAVRKGWPPTVQGQLVVGTRAAGRGARAFDARCRPRPWIRC